MASGNYPVKRYDKTEYELLQEAKRCIREVLASVGVDDNQVDNAAEDGAYEFRLELAERLIDECMAV